MIDPERVAVAGDWHGNTRWAIMIIEKAAKELEGESNKILLHAGDFGIWPGGAGKRYLETVDQALRHHDMTIWFVDGNHEDFGQLQEAWEIHARRCKAAGNDPALFSIPLRIHPSIRSDPGVIFHLPRGYRWKWHGRTWLALGGAVSVDRAIRVQKGWGWWPEEAITPEQAAAVMAAGPADVMLTHDVPSDVPVTFGRPSSLWTDGDLARSQVHREQLQGVVDKVGPSWIIHGHIHQSYHKVVEMSHGPVDITSLDCDALEGDDRGNWGILNVRTMTWE